MNDKPSLQPDLAVGESLRVIARAILAKVLATIEDPGRTDTEAVHHFRREIKRWCALLRLLEPSLGADSRRLRREARGLARALGGARDAQSALDALTDLAEHGLNLSGHSLRTVRSRIETVRQAVESATLDGEMRNSIVQVLDRALAAVERWPLHLLTFADVADSLTLGYRSARDAIPKSWPNAEEKQLHELRKRVVTHRYQMEIVVPLWQRFGKMWVGEAQRLRDRLGKHRDLLLLQGMTAPHQPLARWHLRLQPAIDQRGADHIRAARRIAGRLFVDKPKAFRRRLGVIWKTSG